MELPPTEPIKPLVPPITVEQPKPTIQQPLTLEDQQNKRAMLEKLAGKIKSL